MRYRVKLVVIAAALARGAFPAVAPGAAGGHPNDAGKMLRQQAGRLAGRLRVSIRAVC